MRFAIKALAAAISVTVIVSVVAAAPASATPANAVAAQAARYEESHNLRTGIAVLDTKSGAFYGAGDYTGYFGSASVVKALIATKILATGRMSGGTAAEAFRMITLSDDNAGADLWNRFGGPSIINWVKAYYNIPFLGFPNTRPGYWGNTHISARGMAYFYAHAKADPHVGPWLLNAMHQYSCGAADGTNQCFGIPSAVGGAAIKQGWGSHSADNWSDAIINTTGLIDGDRYAVAILSEGRANNGSTNSDGFNAPQAAIVSHAARMLLPGGQVDLPANHNPRLRVDSVMARAGKVTIIGWSYDPDDIRYSVAIPIYEGHTLVGYTVAGRPRPDVDRALHLAGNHGFAATFSARPGKHSYCVYARNIGYGTGSTGTCSTVNVLTR